jgi:hypothetical protein
VRDAGGSSWPSLPNGAEGVLSNTKMDPLDTASVCSADGPPSLLVAKSLECQCGHSLQ